MVVSAPGKRTPEDAKITDLLYRCHDCVGDRDAFDRAFQAIAERYRAIVRDLGLAFDIERDLAAVHDGMTRSHNVRLRRESRRIP